MSDRSGSTEFDDRIRALLARAIDDAPPPPDLGHDVPTDQRGGRSRRNRWLLGGATGLGVAACVVGIMLINRPDDVARPTVPATDPTVDSAPAVDPTVDTVLPSVAPTTEPVIDPTVVSVPATVVRTTAPTTVTATTAPATESATIVTAGADGVRLDGAVITTEAMSRAFAVPDGRVFMQRSREFQPQDTTLTALLVVQPGSGTPESLPVPSEFDAGLVLHDAAAVDGDVVLIVETQPPRCAAPDPCVGAIWVFRPDTGQLDQLEERNVWEGGWVRLTLATTGLVVGTESEGPSLWATTFVVPGSGAGPLDLALLGIDETYSDCFTCPSGFGVDPRGGFVSWVESDPVTFQTFVMVAALDGTHARVPLVDRPGGPGDESVCCLDGAGSRLPPSQSVVALDASIVDGIPTGRAVINDELFGFRGIEILPALTVDDLSEGAVSEMQTEYHDAGT